MVRPIHACTYVFNNALSCKPSFLSDVEEIITLKGCHKKTVEMARPTVDSTPPVGMLQ